MLTGVALRGALLAALGLLSWWLAGSGSSADRPAGAARLQSAPLPHRPAVLRAATAEAGLGAHPQPHQVAGVQHGARPPPARAGPGPGRPAPVPPAAVGALLTTATALLVGLTGSWARRRREPEAKPLQWGVVLAAGATEVSSAPCVVLFTTPNCPYCLRAKGLLLRKGWSYTEISLDDYPEKRADMVAAADRTSVPQVFVNGHHIGGCDDLYAADAAGRLDALYAAAAQPGPPNPLLQKPKYPPRVVVAAAPRPPPQITVQGKSFTYGQLLRLLLRPAEEGGLRVSAEKSFSGAEFVDWITASLSAPSRSIAVEVATQLLADGLVRDTAGVTGFRDDAAAVYRLPAHEETGALNTLRLWRLPADPPMAVVAGLTRMLADVVAAFRDGEGRVDYLAMHRSDAFLDFQLATAELQAIDFVAMPPNVRKAFCLNVYNLLVVHAYGEVGVPPTIAGFYPNIRYNIGGHNYSCDDLENGVLRANSPPASGPLALFAPGDPRLQCIMPAVDHRLHFALNCGAKSCPPVKYYTAEGVEDELALAAQAFCEQPETVNVDLQHRVLSLSKLVLWYRVDFGSTDAEVAATLLQHLRGVKREMLQELISSGPFTIQYQPYDWSNDAKSSPPYRLAPSAK